MKKILLTGASGFIGRNMVESYLNKKYEIIAPTSNELNLTDENNVQEYFKNKEFDVILHSAIKPIHRNVTPCNDAHKLNFKMFENLEKQKDKYEKFINFGSGAIYDITKNITDVKEEEIFKCKPDEDFSCCKASIYEKILRQENFVDLNIFGIFGKYEDYSIRFISNAICKAIFDLPITLKQNRRFSYLFIDDLMPILEFFIENTPKYKSYNIVPDDKYELLELAQLIKQISKTDLEIKVQNQGYGLNYTGSNERLKSEFTELKFTNIKNSTERLYNWYSQNKNSINKELLLIDK